MSLVRRIFHHIVPIIAVVIEIWLAIGVVLRLTGWRDRHAGLALVYYTTPWPVVAAGLLVFTIRCGWRRQIYPALIRGFIALLTIVAWFATSWYTGSPSGAEPDFRLVLWNVRNNQKGIEQIAALLRPFSPDVVALAEAGTHLSGIDQWRTTFPGYTLERLPGQMLVLSKTKLQQGPKGLLAGGSYFAVNSTEIAGRRVTILQTDINAEPRRSRKQALLALTDHIRKRTGEPLIVLGDFNTPRQSYHLDSIRGMLTHAFEARGRGLVDTWPIPLPVLSLDQIWVCSELEVVSCRQGWSLQSDHRPVFAELRFKRAGEQP